MLACRIQYLDDLVIGVDVRLRTVPFANQSIGRDLGFRLDAA
jgi:hypothetical protein